MNSNVVHLKDEVGTLTKIKEILRREDTLFDMHYIERTTECGTTRCIGGWAWVVEHPDEGWAKHNGTFITSSRYWKLFYPETDRVMNASAEEACTAIDNFLADPEGRPWDFLLPESA